MQKKVIQIFIIINQHAFKSTFNVLSSLGISDIHVVTGRNSILKKNEGVFSLFSGENSLVSDPVNIIIAFVDITNEENLLTTIIEKCNLKIVWVVFQQEKFNEINTNGKKILNFQSFKNAIEILDLTKPDLILIHGSLEFGNTSFIMAGRFKKIPIVSTYFWHISLLGSDLKFLAIKSRLRLLFSSKTNDSFEKNKLHATKSRGCAKKYIFLINNLKKINFSYFHLIKFILWFTKFRMSRYLLIHKILNVDLNLCSIP